MNERAKHPTEEKKGKEDLKPFSTSLSQKTIEQLKADAKAQPYDVRPAQIARQIIVEHYEKGT
jgi:hypothetical protein